MDLVSEFADFVRGADVLVSEMVLPKLIDEFSSRVGVWEGLGDVISSRHLPPEDTGVLANESGVDRVVLYLLMTMAFLSPSGGAG